MYGGEQGQNVPYTKGDTLVGIHMLVSQNILPMVADDLYLSIKGTPFYQYFALAG